MLRDDDREYLKVEDVARILKLTIRQATRYAKDPEMHTQQSGRRILYLREDVEKLAKRLGAEYREPPEPRPEVLPAGETLALIDRQQAQLMNLSHEVGRLQGLLEAERTQRAQITDSTTQLQTRLDEVEAERNRLRVELEQARQGVPAQSSTPRPWWKRW